MDKLPDANRAADPDETSSFLNESVVDLLKQNRCSSETEKKKRGKRVPKKYKGSKTVVPGKILETIDAAVLNDAVDASDNEDDVDVIDVSLTEELCTICGKGDNLLIIGSDGSEDIEETKEFEWVQCPACRRAYHNSCLHSAIGEDCEYCDFD